MADHGGSGVYYMLHRVVCRMRSSRSWWVWLILYAKSHTGQDEEWQIMVGVAYIVCSLTGWMRSGRSWWEWLILYATSRSR